MRVRGQFGVYNTNAKGSIIRNVPKPIYVWVPYVHPRHSLFWEGRWMLRVRPTSPCHAPGVLRPPVIEE